MSELIQAPVLHKINRYQIVLALLTAALTYQGLSLLAPVERTQHGMEAAADRIDSAQAAAVTPSSQAPVGVHGPVVEAIPLETQIVHSSKSSSRLRRHVRSGKHHAQTIKRVSGARLETPVSLELARQLQLGLVPEMLILPKGEEYEVSSLILVKPRTVQKSIVKD